MEKIPRDHPRFHSLQMREKLVEAQKKGLLAPVATIAHGRGEAFDYLLGEKTCPSAKQAIKVAARLLLGATRPVISINGNTAVLARKSLFKLAKTLQCPIEINIFYRTPERMEKLISYLANNEGIEILGEEADARIPNLSSERSKCSKEGIFSADVVFVPLEDGDRCEALRKMGKIVIVVDLNPFSRSARTASVTIVDNITRCIDLLTKEIQTLKDMTFVNIDDLNFDNSSFLNQAVEEIKARIDDFKKDPLLSLKEN